MKRIIKTALLILFIFLIFYFSNQPGEQSLQTSGFFVEIINNMFEKIKNIELFSFLNNIDQALFVKKVSFLIRKSAHFFEFFILYILTYECLKEYPLNKTIIIAIIFCLLIACLDEIHQMITPNRTPSMIDVMIDFSGSLMAYLFWHHIFKK